MEQETIQALSTYLGPAIAGAVILFGVVAGFLWKMRILDLSAHREKSEAHRDELRAKDTLILKLIDDFRGSTERLFTAVENNTRAIDRLLNR